jgi:cytochrome o ubiquinol oxidase subunit II
MLMSQKHKKGNGRGRLAWFIPLLLVGFGLIIALLVHDKNIALLNSQGLIAQEQRKLLIYILTLLFAVAIPVLFVLYFTAWKYRESNTKAAHYPEARQGKLGVTFMWLFPTVILLVLTAVLYPATHRLEPHKKISANAKKPLTIQVVSMRWKWVFIYPEQKIATVNFVQIPVDTPVIFELTGDEAPMVDNSIP